MTELTRRNLLAALGAASVVAVATACGKNNDSKTAASTATTATTVGSNTSQPSCTLSPEMTEGPYYISGEAVRSDITEGKAGTPLKLELTVADASSCAVIPSAAVDVWHADASGDYSGFGNGSSSRTYLRGTQVTDANGKVSFTTIYPGWYQGRATHIHLKVHVGGNVVHTGQLFFDEAINGAVYQSAPYSQHSGTRTLNSQDGIYSGGGSRSIPALTKNGTGYVATITLGVKR